jgi:exonuclease III
MERSLIDPFREFYPDLQRYTWHKKNPFKMARLDFLLITENILSNLKNCKVEPSYRLNNMATPLEFELNDEKKHSNLHIDRIEVSISFVK